MLETMSEDFFPMCHCFTDITLSRPGPDKLRWWRSPFKIAMNWTCPYESVTESYNETSSVVFSF